MYNILKKTSEVREVNYETFRTSDNKTILNMSPQVTPEGIVLHSKVVNVVAFFTTTTAGARSLVAKVAAHARNTFRLKEVLQGENVFPDTRRIILLFHFSFILPSSTGNFTNLLQRILQIIC